MRNAEVSEQGARVLRDDGEVRVVALESRGQRIGDAVGWVAGER